MREIKAAINDAAWTDIDVPSSWQVWGLHHGKSWDKPLYCNVAYPFSFNESTYSVMADRPGWFTYNSNMPNPVGTYRRHFNVTADMLTRDVYVRFNGVGHGFYLWVNGQRVGYSEDSYVPAEFNITKYLVEGGKRMVFHGVNRHDFSPVNGRAIADAEIEEDIKTMKRLNINAVRTSHYPNDPVFYDLCDKYGLYVLAEADVECHAYQKLSSVQLFRLAMVERSENHVRWMCNHPCIFMWSFGNESGNGENFKYVAQAIKALDTTRPTHYEGNSDYADVSSTFNDVPNDGNFCINGLIRPDVVAEEKLQLRTAKKPMYDLDALETCEALSVEDGTQTVTVQNSTFKAVFSKSQGTLTAYTYQGTEMLSKPLLLNAFRLPTDNDGRQSESWDNMGLRKMTVKGNETEVQAHTAHLSPTTSMAAVLMPQNQAKGAS